MVENIERTISQSPTELEAKVLKAIFKRKNALLDIIEIVDAKHFTVSEYASIYTAMCELYKKDSDINLESVSIWLEQNGYKVDINVIKKLYNESYTAIKIKKTAEDLRELYIRRTILENVTDLISKQQDKPTTSNQILGELNDIAIQSNDLVTTENVNTKGFDDPNSMLADINLKLTNKVSDTGLLTGIQVIDNDLNGLLGGKLWCVVADSQVGKSQMAIQLATRALLLNKDINVFYYSLEMTKREVEERALAVTSGIEPRFISDPRKYFTRFDEGSNTIRNLYEENPNSEIVNEFKSKIKKGIDKLNSLNLYIDDTPDLNTEALLARIQKNHIKYGRTDLIIIDHINILCSGTPSEEVGLLKEAYNRLKQISKKLNCTVIALHQFSKKELSADSLHKPTIFALTGGSAPRHFADVIMSIWRPCVYRDVMDAHPELKDHCDIDFQKVRYTARPDVTLMDYNGYLFTEKSPDETKGNIIKGKVYIDSDGNFIDEDEDEE